MTISGEGQAGEREKEGGNCQAEVRFFFFIAVRIRIPGLLGMKIYSKSTSSSHRPHAAWQHLFRLIVFSGDSFSKFIDNLVRRFDGRWGDGTSTGDVGNGDSFCFLRCTVGD